MTRKHSSMGVLKPAMSTKLTNTQMLKNNLEQEEAVLRDVQEYIDLNVNRQYIQEFQGDLQSQLTVQEFDAQYGAEIEAKLQNWAGYSQQLSVLCVVCTYVQEKVFEKVIRNTITKVKTIILILFLRIIIKPENN